MTSWEKEVAQHFDKSARSYGDSYNGDTTSSHFFRTRQKIIMSLLSKLSGGTLLDIGCGPGLMAEPCASQGFRYFGIDISEGMISECRNKSINLNAARFFVGKMQSLPFADDFFDVLLCLGALEYVPAAEEVPAHVEMIRVVKLGGLLIISYLNRVSPYWLWSRLVYWKMRLMKSYINGLIYGGCEEYRVDQVQIRQFTEHSSHRVLKRHHLNVIQTLYYGFNIFLQPLDHKFPHLAVTTSKKLERLCNTGLRRLAMAFIMVARKEARSASTALNPS